MLPAPDRSRRRPAATRVKRSASDPSSEMPRQRAGGLLTDMPDPERVDQPRQIVAATAIDLRGADAPFRRAKHARTEPARSTYCLLAAYGIPTVPTSIAASPQEVERIAIAQLKQAPTLAIKVLSKDITHKSEVVACTWARLTCRSARRRRDDDRARGEGAPGRAASGFHRTTDDCVAERA